MPWLTPDVAEIPGLVATDPGLGLAAASVEAAVALYLGWDPTPGTRVAYLDGDGTDVLWLPVPSRSVAAVAEVRCDPRGYGGAAPGGFGSATVQAPGVDYAATPGRLARLVRLRRPWPGLRTRAARGSLADSDAADPGAVMVTYAVGPVSPSVLMAGAVELSARWQSRGGFGAELSTTLDWHTRSITMFGADGADGAAHFVSPLAPKYLAGLRRKAVC